MGWGEGRGSRGAGPTLPLMMVSMVMSAYSSAAGSMLPVVLLRPSTMALPPARGAQRVLAARVAYRDPKNAREGSTFANIFSEIKQSLQDGISLLCYFHVLINLKEENQRSQVRTLPKSGHSRSGAFGGCGASLTSRSGPIWEEASHSQRLLVAR